MQITSIEGMSYLGIRHYSNQTHLFILKAFSGSNYVNFEK